MPLRKYAVIRDTREKEGQGWTWRKSTYCAGTERRKLDQGDYAIKGHEDFMIIERKGSVSEWAQNVVQDRFTRELERSRHIPHVWIVLEFRQSEIMSYPVGSGIPKSKWRFLRCKGPLMMKRMTEIQMEYPNVRIWLAGEQGKDVAATIFKRTVEALDARN